MYQVLTNASCCCCAIQSYPPSVPSYLVNFLLDSTVGLLLIYLLLKAVASIVAYFQITALKSGEYGEWRGCGSWEGLGCQHLHAHTHTHRRALQAALLAGTTGGVYVSDACDETDGGANGGFQILEEGTSSDPRDSPYITTYTSLCP